MAILDILLETSYVNTYQEKKTIDLLRSINEWEKVDYKIHYKKGGVNLPTEILELDQVSPHFSPVINEIKKRFDVFLVVRPKNDTTRLSIFLNLYPDHLPQLNSWNICSDATIAFEIKKGFFYVWISLYEGKKREGNNHCFAFRSEVNQPFLISKMIIEKINKFLI